VVSAVAAATGAFATLTGVKYTQISASLRDMPLTGAASLVFLVPATTAQMPEVQSTWRARGATGLVLKPSGNNREHIFSIFTTPLSSAGATVSTGTDAAQSIAPTQAMTQARAGGQVTVSDTFALIADRGLAADRRQLSFVLTAAVFEPPDARGRREFRGWVAMAVRGQDFMGATLRSISQNLLDVTLSARNADRALVPVAQLRSPSAGGRDLHR
jgi:hypothetical protein